MSWNFVSYKPIPEGTDLSWMDLGRCKDGDPDAMFVVGHEQNLAKRVCRLCPVRYECLAYALDHKIEWGVWGGKTERERRTLLRRNPNTQWRRRWQELGVFR